MEPSRIRARARALGALRGWFADQGYLEVPTPARVRSPALEEHLFAVPSGDLWLRTSPEFALKKVVASGLPRVYEIGPCWRDRERGDWHRTEFTMIEWYRAGAALTDLMGEVESLVHAVAHALEVEGPTLWQTATIRQLFHEHTGIDLTTARLDTDESWDDAFFRLWVTKVEPELRGAVFVTEWPASQAALATVRDDRAWPTAERFEVFLDGIELANAFQELIDPVEQTRRFHAANATRDSMGEAPHPVDEALIEAVGRMPRTAGIAMGFDRLVAALMGWSSIE